MTKPAKKRQKPYIWPTWVASLMGDDKLCKYTAWLCANYLFDKLPSDYDSSAHDEMVNQRAMEYKTQGFAVYVEDENFFTIKGKTCDIGGKPDIVIENGQVTIEDCKSGKRKASHRFQVLIYMLLYFRGRQAPPNQYRERVLRHKPGREIPGLLTIGSL